MKHLPKKFEGRGDTGGWVFRQLRRNDKWALYERTRGSKDVSYELVRICCFSADKEINGNIIGRKGDERYPSASRWGMDGFSYITREASEMAYRGKK